jgi:hypothetical protein
MSGLKGRLDLNALAADMIAMEATEGDKRKSNSRITGSP